MNKTEATNCHRLTFEKKGKEKKNEKQFYTHLIFCYYVELKQIAVTYRLHAVLKFICWQHFNGKCNTELINGEVGFQGASTRYTEHRPLREKNRRLNETLKRYV